MKKPLIIPFMAAIRKELSKINFKIEKIIKHGSIICSYQIERQLAPNRYLKSSIILINS